MKQLLFGTLGALVALAPHAAWAAVADPVKIESGQISGADTATPSVRVFKGIPFAAPPTGDHRWRAPQPVAKWDGVRKADAFGAPCLANAGAGRGGGGGGGRRGGGAPGVPGAAPGAPGGAPGAAGAPGGGGFGRRGAAPGGAPGGAAPAAAAPAAPAAPPAPARTPAAAEDCLFLNV